MNTYRVLVTTDEVSSEFMVDAQDAAMAIYRATSTCETATCQIISATCSLYSKTAERDPLVPTVRRTH